MPPQPPTFSREYCGWRRAHSPDQFPEFGPKVQPASDYCDWPQPDQRITLSTPLRFVSAELLMPASPLRLAEPPPSTGHATSTADKEPVEQIVARHRVPSIHRNYARQPLPVRPQTHPKVLALPDWSPQWPVGQFVWRADCFPAGYDVPP